VLQHPGPQLWGPAIGGSGKFLCAVTDLWRTRIWHSIWARTNFNAALKVYTVQALEISFSRESSGWSKNDEASGWTFLVGAGVLSSFECFETVGRATGRVSSLTKLCYLSPKLFLWSKKPMGIQLIKVHLQNGRQNGDGEGARLTRILRNIWVSERNFISLLTFKRRVFLGNWLHWHWWPNSQELIRRWDSERELLRSAPGSYPNSLK